MADAIVQLPYTGTTSGDLLDAESVTVGANAVKRERMQITGSAATAIALVTSSGGLRVSLSTLAGQVVGISSGIISLSSNPTVNVSSGIITLSSNPTVNVSSGVITLSSAIGISSGTITLSSNPTVNVSSGIITLSSNPTVNISSGVVTLSSAIGISSGTITLSSNPTVNVSSGVISISSGTVTLSSNPTVNVSSGIITLSSAHTVNVSSGIISTLSSGPILVLENSTGGVLVNAQRGVVLAFVNIRATSSGLTELVAVSGSNKVKLVSYTIVCNSTQGVSFYSSNTAICASSSAPMVLSSYSGISAAGDRSSWLMETSAAGNLRIHLDNAGIVAGGASYFYEV